MKKYIPLLLAIGLLIPFTGFAKEKTLFSDKLEHGGYGGPVFKITSINGELSFFSGGRGGWIINHTFVIGGGGYRLLNDVSINGNDLNINYGSFEFEYIYRSEALIHFTVHTGIGFGNVSYAETDFDDRYFFIEPSLNAEINVVEWFRINAGAGYLYVNGIEDMPGLSDSDIRGIMGSIVFKFGAF